MKNWELKERKSQVEGIWISAGQGLKICPKLDERMQKPHSINMSFKELILWFVQTKTPQSKREGKKMCL